MPETFKVLGQADLAAATLTDLYTVPAATQTVVSSIVLANRGGAGIKVRVSLAVAGAADTNKQYIVYDRTVPANDFLTLVLGIGLQATDKIRVQSDTATCEANATGVEIT